MPESVPTTSKRQYRRTKFQRGERSSTIARITLDETPRGNGWDVAITVEHPSLDRGVRTFWRHDDTVARGIRSHLRADLDADIDHVVIRDRANVGLTAEDVLDDPRLKHSTRAPSVEVKPDV